MVLSIDFVFCFDKLLYMAWCCGLNLLKCLKVLDILCFQPSLVVESIGDNHASSIIIQINISNFKSSFSYHLTGIDGNQWHC
jgi:hypothetical protein